MDVICTRSETMRRPADWDESINGFEMGLMAYDWVERWKRSKPLRMADMIYWYKMASRGVVKPNASTLINRQFMQFDEYGWDYPYHRC